MIQDTKKEDRPLSSEPTSSTGGSWEKIEIMRKRLESGEALFHPCDELRFELRCNDAHSVADEAGEIQSRKAMKKKKMEQASDQKASENGRREPSDVDDKSIKPQSPN